MPLTQEDMNASSGDTAGMTWRFFSGLRSEEKNYFRYQMWNFLTQMHTGHKRGNTCNARFPIPLSQFDQQEQGSYEWDKYSFNYYIDMGLFDVYQLHRYGGDDMFGRKTGLTWLKNTLQRRGLNRPVVICQHYDSRVSANPDEAGWSAAQKDGLGEVLLPYNVICLMVGHLHDLNRSFPTWPLPNQRNTISPNVAKAPIEVRPGAAFCGGFALGTVRTNENANPTLEFLFGVTIPSDTNFQWTAGSSLEIKPKPDNELYIRGIEVRLILL